MSPMTFEEAVRPPGPAAFYVLNETGSVRRMYDPARAKIPKESNAHGLILRVPDESRADR